MTYDETSETTTANDVTAPAVATETKATKKRETSTSINGLVLTITDVGGTSTFDAFAYPAAVMQGLAMARLRELMLRSASAAARDAVHARLQIGAAVGRAPKKPAELDPWRKAVAHAAVEETRKAEKPITLEESLANAANISREKLIEAKKHPAVVKHYAKITGAPAASAAALFG